MNFKGNIQAAIFTPRKNRKSRAERIAGIASCKSQGEGASLESVLRAEKKAKKARGTALVGNKDQKRERVSRKSKYKSNKDLDYNKGIDSAYGANGVFISDTQKTVSEIERVKYSVREKNPRIGFALSLSEAETEWATGYRVSDYHLRILREGGHDISDAANKDRPANPNASRSTKKRNPVNEMDFKARMFYANKG